jgi:hypothetical protein
VHNCDFLNLELYWQKEYRSNFIGSQEYSWDFTELAAENTREVQLVWENGPSIKEVLPVLVKWRHVRKLALRLDERHFPSSEFCFTSPSQLQIKPICFYKMIRMFCFSERSATSHWWFLLTFWWLYPWKSFENKSIIELFIYVFKLRTNFMEYWTNTTH